jgi:hypothetical protein
MDMRMRGRCGRSAGIAIVLLLAQWVPCPEAFKAPDNDEDGQFDASLFTAAGPRSEASSPNRPAGRVCPPRAMPVHAKCHVCASMRGCLLGVKRTCCVAERDVYVPSC